MKSIKIQKNKSAQKESINKNVKNKKLKKQNNITLENILKNKTTNNSIKKKNNLNSNINKEEENYNSLISAIESNNSKKVEDLLNHNFFNINKMNNKGFSPLHISVINGNIKIVNLLIKNGAKINIPSSKNKQTPLHLAYLNHNNYSKDIIKLLLDNGADDFILDNNHKRPSDYQLNLKSNINTNIKTNISNQNKNIINNKINLKNIKKEKKDGYKGNIYTLKDSKDNSLVVITMDNISYLTSDENTIFQISDINNKNNSTINNENSYNKSNSLINNKNKNINLKDSLEEENTIETKKIKYYSNNFGENNEFEDSLEISNEEYKNKKNIINKEESLNESKNKKLFNNYSNYIANNIFQNNPSANLDDIFKSLIKNKKYSYIKLIKNNNMMKNYKYYNSIKAHKNNYSTHYENTDNSTSKLVNYNNSNENTNEKTNKKYSAISQYEKKNNDYNFSSLYKANRDSLNSMLSTIYQTNKKRNYKKAKSFTKEKKLQKSFVQINKDCSYLLSWLINLQLSSYYKNFLDNEIYDIKRMIIQMKYPNKKLEYEDLESLLLIHKSGHIFRILTQLEVDAGIIDKTVTNFMINNSNNKDIFESSYIGKKANFSNNLKFNCNNCCNLDIEICGGKNGKKNDLKSFLNRYNLTDLYQNFYHNGFDLINYVILQMYGSYPINNDILENHFHIYDENQRNSVMKAIESEVDKINDFLSSEKYYENSNIIKYDKVVFDKDSNLGNISIIKNDNKNGCYIY